VAGAFFGIEDERIDTDDRVGADLESRAVAKLDYRLGVRASGDVLGKDDIIVDL